ncbi:solute carrier organic anion transporter family member 2B1 isoform X2 [Brienomyrus brachyistius]|nr:solute carrier organic anion transporter family member 2B1 isoform X2 [Brienomyrus brachyistius]
MTADMASGSPPVSGRRARCLRPLGSIKLFVLCQGLLQLAQLLVSGYLKGSITTIEKRYGLSSQMSGLIASFNEVGNTVLIVFVSYFGSRVHRPRCIGVGGLVASGAVLLMALPHFISGPYEYSSSISNPVDNRSGSGLCSAQNQTYGTSRQQNQTESGNPDHWAVIPILLLGQLLLGIGGVPIQPFGISYIDDYASRKNSPLYLGIMFAVTVIGPAFGFLLGSLLLRLYVDFDKLPKDKIELTNEDPRWIGAWWLGFLLAASLLFLTSLPYLFFPAKMPKEDPAEAGEELEPETLVSEATPAEDQTLLEFLKAFPRIVVRTLKNPIFLLVVLAQVNLAAMVAGLATFMNKFIEQQFSKAPWLSNMIIGGVNIPMAMVGIMAGGAIMRKLRMSVRSSALLCTVVVFASVLIAMPLLLLGCPTQDVAGIFPSSPPRQDMWTACSLECACDLHAYNPVCGSNAVEFQSPCHAGCTDWDFDKKNYTGCRCIGENGTGSARGGSCGTRCTHLFLPFLILCALAGFMASLSQTPSFMMILRTVTPEDKSFALGIQFMIFRVLAFMPGPVIYGSAIDTTCILWGEKGKKRTSCRYYNLDLFRQRFLGLQVFFLFGGFICFLMTLIILRRIKRQLPLNSQEKGKLVSGIKPNDLQHDGKSGEIMKMCPPEV